MPRRLDRKIDAAVLDAVRMLLAEVGYSRITMTAIAARAGTSKPAIRRRWQSQQHIIVEAMAEARLGVVEPTSGCVVSDLLQHLEALDMAMSDPAMGQVLPMLIPDLRDRPELAAQFIAQFWEPRRSACRLTLQRAIDRGEIRSDVDLELILDMLAGPIMLRHMFGHASTDADFRERLVKSTLSGIAAKSNRPTGPVHDS